MKKGFYPALGTPTNSDGELIKNSFNKQIELMIEAGAQGVLCMGSMGKMESIKNKEYPKIAVECTKTVASRIPVMVGAMDCSVARILDRVNALDSIKIDGIVATAPFYYKVDEKGIINFFKLLSKSARYPIYIYDLPSVTQSPISISHLRVLVEESNIKGIKTGNLNLIMELYRENLLGNNRDFSIFYSNLDLFDVAIKSGITKNLDGMFTCTPYNSRKIYEEGSDDLMILESLNNILKLRNLFLKENVLSAYSYAMKLLNCPGDYHPDYALAISDKLKDEIHELMKEIKEL